MAGSLELFKGVFAHGELARELTDQAWLQAMLDVEAGLARALARAGLVPQPAAAAVTSAARAPGFSIPQLGAASASTGSPIPALVKALTAAVPPSAAEAVHTGATTQDIVDSAVMLLLKRSLPVLAEDLRGAAAAAAVLAEQHADSIMLGRTLLQQATPVTFGLKAASWLSGLDRARVRLRELGETQLVLQFGGAAGTLASLGARGPDVSQLLAEELGLREPLLPWHTQRGPIVEWAGGLALAASVLGKIARDLTLLAQSEVDEVREPAGEGRGGSSTMPQKENPVGAVCALACTRRVPGLVATLLTAAEQEHERAAGAWHAEWESLCELLRLVGSAASWLREVLEGLRVDTRRMRQNLDAARDFPLAERLSSELGAALGRTAAQKLVRELAQRAADSGEGLQAVIAGDAGLQQQLAAAGLDAPRLRALFDPAGYLGSARLFIERALAAHRTLG